MYRAPLLALAVLAVAATACGGSSKPPAAASKSATTTTTPSGSPGTPTCSATEKQQSGKLVVRVTTNGKGVVYAEDSHAKPTTVTATLLSAPWVVTLSLDDSAAHPVQVHVFANRQEKSCTASN